MFGLAKNLSLQDMLGVIIYLGVHHRKCYSLIAASLS